MPRSKPFDDHEISAQEASWSALRSKIKKLGVAPEEVRPTTPDQCLRTPSISLNLLTNDGGIRPGSVVEFYGPESCFKTWIALEMCREAQRKYPDKGVAFIDSEGRVDLYTAANNIGVKMGDMENGGVYFDYSIPDTAQDALNRIRDFVASNVFSFIVVDSVSDLIPKVDYEHEDVTHRQVAGPALILSSAFKMIGTACAVQGVTLWCNNQMRTRLIPIGGKTIAKLEPSGGLALRYAATHRFRVKRVEREEDAESTTLEVVADKLKYGRPLRPFEIPMVFGHGIDSEADLVNVASRCGIVNKSGTWYSYKDTRLGQGIGNAGSMLRENPEIASEIETSVYNRVLLKS